jgi:Yip1 domain
MSEQMTAPANDFVPPPPPAPPMPPTEPVGPKPTKLRPFAIAFFVLGLLLVVLGFAKVVPGSVGTGAGFALWGIFLFAFSFISLPYPAADEQPMSGPAKVLGIFYEPTRVFRNLRSYPYWVAPLLVIAIASAVYNAAFVQRLTPERIVDFTFEKLQDSPIKPPADKMAEAKEQALQQEKQPIQRVQTAAKSFVFTFFLAAFVGTLCFLGVMAFGGRINFWQSFAAVLYSYMPVILITKVVSLILLYIKSPDDVHPALNRDTLVTDNLGILFKPAEHPALFVLGASIGFLSFYGLWLRAKGLQTAGQKVGSSAAWGVSITLWVLALFLGMILASIFSSFLS